MTLNGQSGYLFNRLLKKIPFILDTSNITDMSNMFICCTNLKSLDLSSFDTSKVTDMSNMFNQCTALSSLNLSNFDTSKVTNMDHMFYNCTNLKSLDLSSFDTSKVTNTSSMFSINMELENISGILNLAKVEASYNIGSMFTFCIKLTTVNIKNLNTSGLDLSSCKQLSHDSLMYLINNVIETTTTKTITLGTTNLAKLTDEEKAIATNKGWTLG